MIDTRAMAYVNAYGVLGTLEVLCEIDEPAKKILADLKKPVSLCFEVGNGPVCTFHFTKSGCRREEGDSNSTCKMRFSSPEKFNALIDSAKPGLPVKNPVQVISFLTGPFTRLADRLTALLRPTEAALADRTFFEESTILTMYTVAGAVSALANTDPISRVSASNTVDGEVYVGIRNVAVATIAVKNHQFRTIRRAPKNPRAVMEFADVDLAHGLFAGTVSAVGEVCRGTIRLSGMISMIDNINRILDRVSVYLGGEGVK